MNFKLRNAVMPLIILNVIIFVLQMFLFVSLLGFVDYWIDFRRRLALRSDGRKKV